MAEAAQAAGYASKPLPLFYSLSQAGRAIAAAHLAAPWTLHGHGLSVKPDSGGSPLTTPVKPIGSGGDSFRGVATAVDSPVLNGPAQLGALWAANPDLRDVPIPQGAGAWPRALEFPLGPLTFRHMSPSIKADPETTPVNTGGMIGVSIDAPGRTGREITEALKHYPTMQGAFGLTSSGARAKEDEEVHRGDANGIERANVGMAAPIEMMHVEWWRRQRALASIVEIDEAQPQYPAPQFVGRVLPMVGDGPSPHPLMLWWALLLGLSSLARYEPGMWTAAIDLDNSELAVSLERVLDLAAERVPKRILDALRIRSTTDS